MTPEQVILHKKSRQLELIFQGQSHRLDAEYLRVLSPSAEVRGHGGQSGKLPHGKASVAIDRLEPAGNYALRIIFDDGHDSGIYTWDYLFELCQNRDAYWQEYLEQLHQQGKSRTPDTQVVRLLN